MEPEYNPEQPVYYKYKGVDFLVNEIHQDTRCYDNIYICAYDVNDEGKYPILRFLLTKPAFNEKLLFPRLSLFKSLSSDELIAETTSYLCNLLNNDFDVFSKSVEFNGYYEYHNELYIFFDITKINVVINDIYKNNSLWLAVIDEIINYRSLCNVPIDLCVVSFFTCNQQLCFLVDENDEKYEIPIVCYVGKPESALNFTFIFGEPKTDKNSLLGPFYYFNDFNTAFKNAGQLRDKDGSSVKGGIVRFAVFVGNTKFIENSVNDNQDASEITVQRLHDEKLNQNMERLKLRISDRDGEWAQNYDSAYLGRVELDNGELIDDPVLVVKEYKQQIPLSYHFIDKHTLDKNSNEYSIM